MEIDDRPVMANTRIADPTRRTALVAGILYLVTFAASIPAVLLLQPVLTDPRYTVGPGADSRVIGGAFLDLVNALAATSPTAAIATLPIFLWELFVGLWMTFKGFLPTSPIVVSMANPSA